MQFFPTERNQSNIVPNIDFMVVNVVPKAIKHQLQISSYGCHSNNIHYPWYKNIQPISWFLEDHIKEGKKELNFSEWDSYTSRRKKSKLKFNMNQIKDNMMPLKSYMLVHGESKLSEVDKSQLNRWLDTLL